ncbi:hypothetical protein J6590_049627 [Homalodisca vitripennis]|nr:hypothetical protein J6590_049627 [Homalodisca vitripennis]
MCRPGVLDKHRGVYCQASRRVAAFLPSIVSVGGVPCQASCRLAAFLPSIVSVGDVPCQASCRVAALLAKYRVGWRRSLPNILSDVGVPCQSLRQEAAFLAKHRVGWRHPFSSIVSGGEALAKHSVGWRRSLPIIASGGGIPFQASCRVAAFLAKRRTAARCFPLILTLHIPVQAKQRSSLVFASQVPLNSPIRRDAPL